MNPGPTSLEELLRRSPSHQRELIQREYHRILDLAVPNGDRPYLLQQLKLSGLDPETAAVIVNLVWRQTWWSRRADGVWAMAVGAVILVLTIYLSSKGPLIAVGGIIFGGFIFLAGTIKAILGEGRVPW